MTVPQPPHDTSEPPGKTRTLWHPLLARLLDFSLSSAYTVVPEVHVGKMPLRVDILLVRREGGDLPEAKRRQVSVLLALLNRFTLIEFKGPTDALERGDFAQLVGCAFLWHSQQDKLIDHSEISLVLLAPVVTGAFREELRSLGYELTERERGIYHIAGLAFAVWLVESDVMADRAEPEPILTFISRIFLRNHRSIINGLSQAGYLDLACYVVQQVHQLHTHREDFAMQTGVLDEFAKLDDDLVADFLSALPADWRVRGLPPEERVRGLLPEERVRGLPPEERVRGLSLEDRLSGLSEEEKIQLIELLTRNQGN